MILLLLYGETKSIKLKNPQQLDCQLLWVFSGETGSVFVLMLMCKSFDLVVFVVLIVMCFFLMVCHRCAVVWCMVFSGFLW